jgi:ATP-dependent exoDNAse (exonuclease V) beta subunit
MHAYTRDGTAVHYQATKPGAKNPTRPTNLKDIREQRLLPSVTEYTKMLSAPGLEEYKVYQTIQACYNNPPFASEELQAYRGRITELAGEDAAGAADLGTLIHASLEQYYTDHDSWDGTATFSMPDGKAVPCREFVLPAVHKIEQLGITPLYHELRVVNGYEGYAGTCDLMGKYGDGLAIVDFKSKRTKPDVAVEPIETHPVQIAAYRYAFDLWTLDLRALSDKGAIGANIYISTTEVGRVDAVTYSDDTLSRSHSVFQKLLALWRWRHFDPRVS